MIYNYIIKYIFFFQLDNLDQLVHMQHLILKQIKYITINSIDLSNEIATKFSGPILN